MQKKVKHKEETKKLLDATERLEINAIQPQTEKREKNKSDDTTKTSDVFNIAIRKRKTKKIYQYLRKRKTKKTNMMLQKN